MNYRRVTVTVPFPEDFSEANMKIVFQGILTTILDSKGVHSPTVKGYTEINFLDAEGKPWLIEDDVPLTIKNSDVFNRRFDLLKRSLDLRTTYICHERGITNLRRMEGIKEAGLPFPTAIRVSVPVTLAYTQEIDFVRIAKTTLENKSGKAEITWESNDEDEFEPTHMTIAGKVYRVFHSDSQERLLALMRGEG
jgi:hypothetical protein